MSNEQSVSPDDKFFGWVIESVAEYRRGRGL